MKWPVQPLKFYIKKANMQYFKHDTNNSHTNFEHDKDIWNWSVYEDV